MTINYFDPLSFRDISQLFNTTTGSVPLGSYYRGGLKVPNTASNTLIPVQNAISVSNFYNTAGRSQVFITIASNTYNFDVYAQRGSSYVAGLTDITVVINSGVMVGSTSYTVPSFTIPATFSATDSVSVINNGSIIGAGGTGGDGNSTTVGAVGGTALNVSRPTSVANFGTLAGGGGGGGGGAVNVPNKGANTPGGGGGGGAGFNGGVGGPGNGTGATGTLTVGGAGATPPGYAAGGNGGAQGAQGTKGGDTSGGGGGRTGAVGGLGGFYVVGNANVTWISDGTRIGRVG